MNNQPQVESLASFPNLSLGELKTKIQQLYNFYQAPPRVEIQGTIIDDETGLDIQEDKRGAVIGTWGERLRMKVNDQIRLVQLGTGDHIYVFYPPENR